MRSEKLLAAERTVLMVVDVQDAFVPHIGQMERVIERSRVMIRAARLLDVPIIVTEQYPAGLGRTVEALRGALGEVTYYAKTTFSCCGDEAVVAALRGTGAEQVLLVGIEAHVCIAQTALDVLALGMDAYVAVDATGSRVELDMATALGRMGSLGVILTTTEAAIMEMTVSSKQSRFREISDLIK